jgi:hypothetical protein
MSTTLTFNKIIGDNPMVCNLDCMDQNIKLLLLGSLLNELKIYYILGYQGPCCIVE